ncbi:MAG: patatin-like phospholipase family protein [Alphaproteobacteria bacterium]
MGVGRSLAATVALSALLLQGCGTPVRLAPVPSAATSKALPAGIANARYFVDEEAAAMLEEGQRSVEREREALGNARVGDQLPPANFLAISGGGDNGAFSAGLLVGWTAAGTRPEFKIVTGVSTGSLVAPLAFLGPSYDSTLKEVYTTISKKDVFLDRGLTAAIFDDALSDTSPLFATISKHINTEMLAAIAREYDRGRLLLIGTTNLDAQRPVIWNMGAIAASGKPGSLELFRQILLASAAVPAAFPPVMIDVEIDGQHYQEMHVDGGAIAQMFLYPPTIQLREASRALNNNRERHAYLIRNGRLDPEWNAVERSTLTIAGRAISTMIHMSGINDLIRIWNTTQRDGVDFNLAFIGSNFEAPRAGDFDPAFMSALFEYGYAQAARGNPWHKTLPFMKPR